MYKTSTWPKFTGTTHLHERVYVTRPNDPGLWTQFTADPCVGTPCDQPRQYIGHGVDQLRYDRYKREYQTPVFCLDQLNTIEEGIAKMAAIAAGYQDLPEMICSDFLRLLTLRKAGTHRPGRRAVPGRPSRTPAATPSPSTCRTTCLPCRWASPRCTSNNSLLINLNANGGLTAMSITHHGRLAAPRPGPALHGIPG